MKTTKSFCWSVLFPMATLLATALLFGCDQPKQPKPPKPPTPVSRPTIVAFGAPWCGACVAGEPKLAALEQRGVAVVRVNIDLQHDEAAKYKINSIPVYIVIRRGHVSVRTQDVDVAVNLVNDVWR